MKQRIKQLLTPSSDYQSLNTIEIHANNLIHNFHTLKKLQTTDQRLETNNHTIIPVLKSNAYGHGLREVCQIIEQHLTTDECPLIAVDSYPEYQIVRDTTTRDILILGEQLPSNYHLYDPRRTHFAVGSLTNLQALIETEKHRNIHLFLNTGMNREGFQEQDIDTLTQVLSLPSKSLHIIGLMSHFANADCVDSSYNHTQIDRFKKMHHKLISRDQRLQTSIQYIHTNNSAGIIKNDDTFFTASRSGLAFYGYNPLQPDDPHHPDYSNLRPALRLTSTITAIQHLQPGDSISYGHIWTATKPTTVATIPLGYHEGLPRSLSNAGYEIYIVPGQGEEAHEVSRGSYHPLIGTICMNISLLQGSEDMQLFDTIELISPDPSSPNSIQSMSQTADHIPYEILVKIDPKIKRIIT